MKNFFRQQLNHFFEREKLLQNIIVTNNIICCILLFLAFLSFFCIDMNSSMLRGETIYRGQISVLDRSTTDRDGYDQDFNSYSSELIRKMRPPKPSNFPQDMQYPPGFLTETKPLDIVSPNNIEKQTLETIPQENGTIIEQELDSDDSSPNIEPLEQSPKLSTQEKGVAFSIFFALLLLAGFFFYDFRYRQWLEHILEQNSHLLSPAAVSADFTAILHSSPSSFGTSDEFSEKLSRFVDNSLFSENTRTYFDDFSTKKSLSEAVYSEQIFNSNLNSSDLQTLQNDSYESNAALLDISDMTGYQVRQSENQ